MDPNIPAPSVTPENTQSIAPQPPRKNTFLLGIGIVVLLLLTAGGAYYVGTLQNQSGNQKQIVDPEFSNVPPLTTTYPSPSPFAQSLQTTSLSLYNLEVQLPAGWTLQEINRRPEPSDPANSGRGHDCADYLISSTNGYATLSLKPNCGFTDGGGDLWPPDAVIVKTNADDDYATKYIIRFFDSEKNVYKYAHGGETTITDIQGTRIEKVYNPILAFTQGSDIIFIKTEFAYTGPIQEKDATISLSDAIIASLQNK